MTSSRDSWCTPKWLAEALGVIAIDPCSNERSNLDALIRLDGSSPGLDGLVNASWFKTDDEPFINPPYSRGQVEYWVAAWQHTNYTFLLRWDPSTRWHKQLMQTCRTVWFPRQRVNFEPPPGVKSSSNPFPHALFFKAEWRDIPHEREYALCRLGQFYEPCR